MKWRRRVINLDGLHELSAMAVDEIFPGPRRARQLFHHSSSYVQYPYHSLRRPRFKSIKLPIVGVLNYTMIVPWNLTLSTFWRRCNEVFCVCGSIHDLSKWYENWNFITNNSKIYSLNIKIGAVGHLNCALEHRRGRQEETSLVETVNTEKSDNQTAGWRTATEKRR